MKQRIFFLVYQAGIANVFEVDCSNFKASGRKAERVLQGDFSSCELFARGLALGNHIVHTAACNRAGDVTNSDWSEDLESQPFSSNFRPVTQTKVLT